MHKLCAGKVPTLHNELLDEVDHALIREIEESKPRVQELLEQYKFREALFEVIDLARKGNKYLQEKEPWKKKILDDPQGVDQLNQRLVDNCLHLCLQLTANLGILVNPFLPGTAKKICHLLKVVDKMLDWENAGKVKLLSVGYNLRAPELLFRKIEDEEMAAQVEKLHKNASQPPVGSNPAVIQVPASELKPPIQYEDFAKLDLRVGTILHAEKVPKADKLLRLDIDLGFEKRTVVSGIAQQFNPAEIIGRQVVVVANLAPRKMKGIESNGMILMAEDGKGKLIFVRPDQATTPGDSIS